MSLQTDDQLEFKALPLTKLNVIRRPGVSGRRAQCTKRERNWEKFFPRRWSELSCEKRRCLLARPFGDGHRLTDEDKVGFHSGVSVCLRVFLYVCVRVSPVFSVLSHCVLLAEQNLFLVVFSLGLLAPPLASRVLRLIAGVRFYVINGRARFASAKRAYLRFAPFYFLALFFLVLRHL